jgi:hypothetical protein
VAAVPRLEPRRDSWAGIDERVEVGVGAAD